MKPMDAIEFNLAVRSLPDFLRRNKSVGLLVIDGIHFIENQDFQAQFEKKQVKQIVNNKGTSVEAMAAAEVPTGDDFFGVTHAETS